MANKKSKTSKKGQKADAPKIRVISENRRARHKFEVLETLECGIALMGSEVKSLRNGHLSLNEAYGRIRNGEVWMVGSDIPEYPQATLWNHAPKRPRKLLLHKSQIKKFAGQATEKGLTLVPLQLFFNERGLAKVVLGLCKGKKIYDKREALKKADTQRGLQRAMRRRE